MKQQHLLSLLFVSVLFISDSAFGETVFDNGGLPYGNFATGSDVVFTYRLAENFSFEKTAAVNSIEFLGLYRSGSISSPIPTPSDNFMVEFYNTISGSPGSVIHIANVSSLFRQAAFSAGSNSTGFLYQMNVGEVTFPAGEQFWLSITNDTSHTSADDYWSWASTTSPGDGAKIKDETDLDWSSRSFNYAFNLSGHLVPEPSVIALAFLGTLLVLSSSPCRIGFVH
jgi:hypothetical protein